MSKDSEVGIKQLAWLFERMAAKQDPVTPEQLQLFAKFHQGQVLPPECIEAKRLPYDFGYELGGKNYVTDIALGPNDEPCLMFAHDGSYKCLVGDREYALVEVGDFYGWGVSLLGFTSDGVPITGRFFRHNVSDLAVCGEWELLSSADYFLRIGGQDIWKSQGVFAAAMLDKIQNIFIFCRALPGKENHFMIGIWDQTTNAETVLVPDCDQAVRRFTVLNVKRIYCYWSTKNSGGSRRAPEIFHVGRVTDGKIVPYLIETRAKKIPRYKIVEVINIDGRVLFLGYSGEYDDDKGKWIAPHEHYCLFEEKKGILVSVQEAVARESFSDDDYSGNLTRLQPGLFAFSGMTKRDRLCCWYVDGVPGIAFKEVSPLFKRDEQWLYYACAGRHLFTMELKVPQSVLDKLAEEEDGRRQRAEWKRKWELKEKQEK